MLSSGVQGTRCTFVHKWYKGARTDCKFKVFVLLPDRSLRKLTPPCPSIFSSCSPRSIAKTTRVSSCTGSRFQRKLHLKTYKRATEKTPLPQSVGPQSLRQISSTTGALSGCLCRCRKSCDRVQNIVLCGSPKLTLTKKHSTRHARIKPCTP